MSFGSVIRSFCAMLCLLSVRLYRFADAKMNGADGNDFFMFLFFASVVSVCRNQNVIHLHELCLVAVRVHSQNSVYCIFVDLFQFGLYFIIESRPNVTLQVTHFFTFVLFHSICLSNIVMRFYLS